MNIKIYSVMRYLKLFESFDESEIRRICKEYYIKNYTINPDGSIDVDGDVRLSDKNLSKIPLKFNRVNGSFDCRFNKLTTLEGSPIEVNGFGCSNNFLTSLQYAPKIIRGVFLVQYNNIKSFEYFPSFVKGMFECYGNPIFQVWNLFRDTTKIELLNDFDIFRDEDTRNPSIIMDRLNDFLLTIGKYPVQNVRQYKNI